MRRPRLTSLADYTGRGVAGIAILNLPSDDGMVAGANALPAMTAKCDPTSDLLPALRTHFGHHVFRPGQEQLVAAVLNGHDVLAVMPTGSGKSLGYQLPAVVLPGMTLSSQPNNCGPCTRVI